MIKDRPIFGREKALKALEEVLSREQGITLLIGETGVGKSRLLDAYCQLIKEDYRQNCYIGYYDKDNSLISEPMSYTYPISVCLNSLIEDILGEQSKVEDQQARMTKLVDAFKKVFKNQGGELLNAVLEDLATKAGFGKTAGIAKKLYGTIKEPKNSLRLSADVLSNQKEDIFGIYLNTFNLLAKEFSDRKFILIFDQMEYVGKAPIDFLLNLAKFLPDSFHFIISFKTEERRWEDPVVKRLYEDTYGKIVYDLKGKLHRLEGLSAEAIGDWIFSVRNKRLPLVPDLTRIRNGSAGLPIILEEWIYNSKDLDPDEIKIDNQCLQLNRLLEGLSETDRIRIGKMSVMLGPIDTDFLVPYLEFNADEFGLFTERMINKGIFDESKKWFRHELVKKCIERELHEDVKKQYHRLLSELYSAFDPSSQKIYDDKVYKIHLEYANLLHKTSDHYKSLIENQNLADIAHYLGNLDLAERSYKRAIYAGERLKNPPIEKLAECYLELGNVLVVWGRLNDALDNLRVSLGYYSDLGDERNIAKTMNRIGIVYDHMGDHGNAVNKYFDALEISRKVGDSYTESQILINLGVICDKERKFSQALRFYEDALAISRKLEDKKSIASGLGNIGIVLGTLGRSSEALSRFEESLSLLKQSKDEGGKAAALVNIGILHSEDGNYKKAIENFEEGLSISIKLGDERSTSAALFNIGKALELDGKPQEAREKYEQALDIAQKIKDQYHIDLILKNMKDIK